MKKEKNTEEVLHINDSRNSLHSLSRYIIFQISVAGNSLPPLTISLFLKRRIPWVTSYRGRRSAHAEIYPRGVDEAPRTPQSQPRSVATPLDDCNCNVRPPRLRLRWTRSSWNSPRLCGPTTTNTRVVSTPRRPSCKSRPGNAVRRQRALSTQANRIFVDTGLLCMRRMRDLLWSRKKRSVDTNGRNKPVMYIIQREDKRS